MFRKCLMTSIVFHMLLIIGAGIDSPHPPMQPRPAVFQLMAANVHDTAGMAESIGETQLAVRTKSVSVSHFKKASDDAKTLQVGRHQIPQPQPKDGVADSPESGARDATAYFGSGEGETDQSGLNIPSASMTGSNSNGSPSSGENIGLGGSDFDKGAAGAGKQGRDKITPHAIDQPRSYPLEARSKGWEGTVKLEALLNKKGRIESIKLLQSSGYKILDDTAIRMVKKWRYKPVVKDGVPIDWTLRITIPFKLEDN